MKTSSFIFNFKIILTFVCALFIFDRGFYYLLYPTYDITYGASAVASENQIYLAGSSHFQKSIDLTTLSKSLSKKVGGFIIPQSNLLMREFAIRERMENSSLKKPEWIFLETSKYVLNPKRYNEYSTLIIPYYHRGYFKALVEHDQTKTQWFLHRLFHSYGYNFQFAQNFFDPANVLRFWIEKKGSEDQLQALRHLTGRVQKDFPSDVLDEKERIDRWWKDSCSELTKESLNEDIDPALVASFNRIVSIALQAHVKLALIEPPTYRFSPKEYPETRRYEKTYELFQQAVREHPGQIYFVSVDFKNESRVLEDVSHLNVRYRDAYTQKLVAEIKRFF